MLEYNRRTYLITGGDGFIGRHLVAKLVGNDHKIIVVDNHVTSNSGINNSNVKIIETDVEKLDLASLPQIDGIFHLASIAAPRLFREQPMAVIRPNVHGTERMSKLAEINSCRLIYTSSSETYGSSGDLTSSEKMSENHPSSHLLLSDKSPYSAAKVLGEEIIRSAKERGVDVTSIRLFNVYGANMDPTLQGRGRVIPNFQNALRNGMAIPIEGDGSQSRTFTWIDDVVDGLVKLMQHPTELPLVMNMGSEETTTIFELAEIMAKALNIDPIIEYTERLTGDPDWRCPDCTLLRQTIGWFPQTTLQEGLEMLMLTEKQHHVQTL
jgi:nucleoside-diphosphate-sugar epimerase